MPFQVFKDGDKFKLKNLHTNVIVNKSFNSKETALQAGLNYMAYRGEKGVIKGNKILPNSKNASKKNKPKVYTKRTLKKR